MSVRIQAAIELVQNGISGKLDVAMLARQVNMSASRLRHVFKKETGLSPIQYIKLKRMQEAEHLLRTTFLSVKEITHRAGFTNESYFSREFRRTHGLPPGKYRRQDRGSRKVANDAPLIVNKKYRMEAGYAFAGRGSSTKSGAPHPFRNSDRLAISQKGGVPESRRPRIRVGLSRARGAPLLSFIDSRRLDPKHNALCQTR